MTLEHGPTQIDELEKVRAAHAEEIVRANDAHHQILQELYRVFQNKSSDVTQADAQSEPKPYVLRPGTPHNPALELYPNGDLRIVSSDLYQGNPQDRMLDGVEYNLIATRELLRLVSPGKTIEK